MQVGSGPTTGEIVISAGRGRLDGCPTRILATFVRKSIS
jgi:hypothetical protein